MSDADPANGAGLPGDEADDAIDDSTEGTEAARLRPKKSPNAFRTISEVADDLHIPQHVLRFWETKFPQVRPLKRGGGRRYYRPDDIALLRRISGLLYVQGYTIKGVQRLLRDGGGKLSDDIPPPSPDDFSETEADEAGDGTPIPGQDQPGASDQSQFDMPGIASSPAARTPLRAVSAQLRDPGSDQEIRRLRAVLVSALEELEALRALLP
jgi:DNA-binding transcriptional MerR regulator